MSRLGRLRDNSLFVPCTCYKCGIHFFRIRNAGYGYLVDGHIFCSYHCMREYERPRMEKHRQIMARKMAIAEREAE